MRSHHAATAAFLLFFIKRPATAPYRHAARILIWIITEARTLRERTMNELEW